MTQPKEYIVRRGPHHLVGKNARTLTNPEILELIGSVRRTADAEAGVRLMRFILEKQGVDGVIEFVEWGQKVLDNTGKILRSDFMPINGQAPLNEDEQEMIRTASPGVLRRNFLLNVGSWYAIALGGAVHSAAGIIEAATKPPAKEKKLKPEDKEKESKPSAKEKELKSEDNEKEPKPDDRSLTNKISGEIRQGLDDYGGYPLEMLGSVSLAYLASKDWREDKFEQISNAIAEMGQIIGVSERLPSYRLKSSQANRQRHH